MSEPDPFESEPLAAPRLHAMQPAGAAQDAATALKPAPLHIEYTHTRVRADAWARLQLRPGVVRRDRSSLAETFRMLRTQVMQRLRQDGHNLLAVTSARPTGSKSLTALNLALTIAAEYDSAVLLVDADLSGQGVQRLFGLPELRGLGEHLSQGAPLADLLLNPGVERFVLLPAGQGAGVDSAELLATRAAQQLVQELRQRYADRIVIFDLPALLDRADAVTFLPQMQATLMVVEEGRTALSDLETATELLTPFNLIGSVLSPPAEPSRRWPWSRRPARDG